MPKTDDMLTIIIEEHIPTKGKPEFAAAVKGGASSTSLVCGWFPGRTREGALKALLRQVKSEPRTSGKWPARKEVILAKLKDLLAPPYAAPVEPKVTGTPVERSEGQLEVETPVKETNGEEPEQAVTH